MGDVLQVVLQFRQLGVDRIPGRILWFYQGKKGRMMCFFSVF